MNRNKPSFTVNLLVVIDLMGYLEHIYTAKMLKPAVVLLEAIQPSHIGTMDNDRTLLF